MVELESPAASPAVAASEGDDDDDEDDDEKGHHPPPPLLSRGVSSFGAPNRDTFTPPAPF